MVLALDDATQYICWLEAFLTQNGGVVETTFKKAAPRCELPTAVFDDNGSQFVSEQFTAACEALGVRHLAKLYSSWLNGWCTAPSTRGFTLSTLGLQLDTVLSHGMPHSVGLITPGSIVVIDDKGVPTRYRVGTTSFFVTIKVASPATVLVCARVTVPFPPLWQHQVRHQ